MRQLTDSIGIDAPSEAVWEWLSALSEHYTEWHPDHVSAEWEHGEPNQVGSILKAVENLGGTREVLRFEMTVVGPPHRSEYLIRGPISLLLPGGAFVVTSEDRGSRFTATISYRFGRLTEHLFKHRTATLRRPMKEEGENLKLIIESAGVTIERKIPPAEYEANYYRQTSPANTAGLKQDSLRGTRTGSRSPPSGRQVRGHL